MARGRKHRAIEVAEASGTFKRDPARRPTNIIKADSRNPEPPDVVKNDENALACWMHTCDILSESNILSRTDEHLLAHYVIVYSEWSKCAAHIQEHGHEDERGKSSAQSVAFFKLSTEHNKLVAELGLSPSSRARLSLATSDPYDAKENSDLRAYLNAIKNG